ncbi:Fur family transcriptional regulator [Amycolatopsis jejuensis]|uniref:Fur family transcriptional regulator n=1 Tax=Amycolatopsis jejuensis TaxID=330084 RepID=UPI0005243B96|nr:Fur family transcriptional regulator [Amycolatopsis jejuensis]
MQVADPVAALRGASLRITRQRIAVLTALRHTPHAGFEHIRDAVRKDLGSVSSQAVYDVLGALLGAGLVRRLELPGSRARFELRTDDHDHLACRVCGAVTDVERTDLPPVNEHGYHIDGAEVTYWGTCPSCLSATPKEEEQ